jgi:chromosome segregation ATPase
MPGRDDDLDLIKGLSVDRDETDLYRHTARTKERRQVDRKPDRKQQQQTSSAQQPAKTSSGAGWFASLLIMVLIGSCGWLGYQLLGIQTQLAETNNSLQLAKTRIDVLGQQLFKTGSNVNETGNTIEKKFSELDSEIRKLWDVSNKRNKSMIADNADVIAQHHSIITSIESALKNSEKESEKIQSQVASLGAGQSKLDKKLLQVANEYNQYKAEKAFTRTTLNDLSEQVLLVRGELEQMQIRLNQLPKNLASRFTESEEAIKAIDSARRQLVSSVTQLQSRINQMQLSIEQSKSAPALKP